MDTVQNYVAADICNRPNIGVAIKGRAHWQPPAPPSSLLHRPFYFSSRNYRETSALLVRRSRSGLYFQQCVIRHALTPVVYFCDVYSPRGKKKKMPNEQRDVDEGPGCKELYRRPRECHFKENCGVSLFYRHKVQPRDISDFWHSRKERSALNLSIRGRRGSVPWTIT